VTGGPRVKHRQIAELIDPDLDDIFLRSKGAGKPEGSISLLGWASRVGFAVAMLFAEFIWTWFLFFSPGWANGWPFGIRFQTVISVALTGWISVILMTVSAGVGAVVGFICALLRLGQKHGSKAYDMWLWISAGLILCLSIPLFGSIYALIMEEFPSGYLTP
jgi:hypothetical protein